MDEYPRKMRFHRTAALALVGWSLMLPPGSHTLRLDLSKDLSKWTVHSTHATEAECKQEKERLEASMAEPLPTHPGRPCGDPGVIFSRLAIAARVAFPPMIPL